MEHNLPSKLKEKKIARVSVLVSDKTDCKLAKIKKDKERHYIMGKGSILQELSIRNTYATNRGALRFIKQSQRPTKRLRLPHNNNGRL